jgi:short-subunit dehydrogenase
LLNGESVMKHQVVMVTGASAGVGRATAIAFASRGASVGLLARGRGGLEGARRDVEAVGGRGLILEADVSEPDMVDAAGAALEAAFGPIDVWVNNAMASVFSPVKRMTAADFKRVTDVTYLGVVHGTLTALRGMLPRNEGAILQVGSALAYRGIPLQAAYCAAKHAIQGFCDSLHSELLHDKSAVTVTMVQLPAVNTPQFDWVKSRLPCRARPVAPVFQPEVMADAIVWAADHPRREMYVGFPTVTAIVGDKIAPELGDWYLASHGYRAQQSGEPEDPGRPHNLWLPVDAEEDFGARGRFDTIARTWSWQQWITRHRSIVIALALTVGSQLLAHAVRIKP